MDFCDRVKTAIAKLPPFEIGRLGQLQEWQQDYEETQPGHRHGRISGRYIQELRSQYERLPIWLALLSSRWSAGWSMAAGRPGGRARGSSILGSSWPGREGLREPAGAAQTIHLPKHDGYAPVGSLPDRWQPRRCQWDAGSNRAIALVSRSLRRRFASRLARRLEQWIAGRSAGSRRIAIDRNMAQCKGDRRPMDRGPERYVRFTSAGGTASAGDHRRVFSQ